MTEPNLRCPACGFRVYNRRYPKCESCAQALPAELVLAPEQVRALAAGEARQARAAMDRRALRKLAGRTAPPTSAAEQALSGLAGLAGAMGKTDLPQA